MISWDFLSHLFGIVCKLLHSTSAKFDKLWCTVSPCEILLGIRILNFIQPYLIDVRIINTKTSWHIIFSLSTRAVIFHRAFLYNLQWRYTDSIVTGYNRKGLDMGLPPWCMQIAENARTEGHIIFHTNLLFTVVKLCHFTVHWRHWFTGGFIIDHSNKASSSGQSC